jgi:uncharacterized protein YdaU (DUF1376 family)
VNYYERHIGDYLKDTAHLSLIEHGVYGRLLDVYYTRECAIPVAQAERLIGVRTKEERAALENVLAEFFTVDAGALHHARCDREIARYQEKQRKAAASANARWSKGSGKANADAPGMRTHMRTHCEGNAPSNQTPDTSNQNQGANVERQQVGPVGPARADFENRESGSGPGSDALAAAAAMAGAGLQGVSAGHPTLRALLAGGMTLSELQAAAVAAVAQGKGFAWALARAEGQRRDAAAIGVLPAAVGSVVDPDSKAGIEADAARLGIDPWQQVDAQGRTVAWSAWADKVRAAREAAGVPA